MGLWKGWKDETREAYLNGGVKLGRYLIQFPERVPDIWNLVKDVGLWPRKYLQAFKAHYRKDNPEEATRLYKKGDKNRRLRRQSSERRLEEAQDALERAKAKLLS